MHSPSHIAIITHYLLAHSHREYSICFGLSSSSSSSSSYSLEHLHLTSLGIFDHGHRRRDAVTKLPASVSRRGILPGTRCEGLCLRVNWHFLFSVFLLIISFFFSFSPSFSSGSVDAQGEERRALETQVCSLVRVTSWLGYLMDMYSTTSMCRCVCRYVHVGERVESTHSVSLLHHFHLHPLPHPHGRETVTQKMG